MWVKEELVGNDLYNELWSGAVDNFRQMVDDGADPDDILMVCEELLGGGEDIPTMTSLNDLIWFEPEIIYESLGLDTIESACHGKPKKKRNKSIKSVRMSREEKVRRAWELLPEDKRQYYIEDQKNRIKEDISDYKNDIKNETDKELKRMWQERLRACQDLLHDEKQIEEYAMRSFDFMESDESMESDEEAEASKPKKRSRGNKSVLSKTVNECIQQGISEIDFDLFGEICTFDFEYPDEPMYVNSYGATYELDRNSTEPLYTIVQDSEDDMFEYPKDISHVQISKTLVKSSLRTIKSSIDDTNLSKSINDCIQDGVTSVDILVFGKERELERWNNHIFYIKPDEGQIYELKDRQRTEPLYQVIEEMEDFPVEHGDIEIKKIYSSRRTIKSSMDDNDSPDFSKWVEEEKIYKLVHDEYTEDDLPGLNKWYTLKELHDYIIDEDLFSHDYDFNVIDAETGRTLTESDFSQLCRENNLKPYI